MWRSGASESLKAQGRSCGVGGFLDLGGDTFEEVVRILGDVVVGGGCGERGVEIFRRFGDLNCPWTEGEDVSDDEALLT